MSLALEELDENGASFRPEEIDPRAVGVRALAILKRSAIYKRSRQRVAGEIEASFLELRRWLEKDSLGSPKISAEEATECLADHVSRLIRFRLARADYGNRQARAATGERERESFEFLVSKGFDEGALRRLNQRIAAVFSEVKGG